MPSSHLILCRPLLLLPPIPPSIRVFSNESILLMKWPKYWSFNFNISPSKEHPGLIFSRMDWLDLLACSPRDSQEPSPTPQFKNINSSALSFLHSATLTSIHDYWKNHSLDLMDICWQSNVSAFWGHYASWNKLERQILYVLTYIRNLKSWIHRHRDQNDGFQVMRRGYGEMRVKGYQHSSLRWISSGHLVHIMVIIANKTVLYPWKLWRE